MMVKNEVMIYLVIVLFVVTCVSGNGLSKSVKETLNIQKETCLIIFISQSKLKISFITNL